MTKITLDHGVHPNVIGAQNQGDWLLSILLEK